MRRIDDIRRNLQGGTGSQKAELPAKGTDEGELERYFNDFFHRWAMSFKETHKTQDQLFKSSWNTHQVHLNTSLTGWIVMLPHLPCFHPGVWCAPLIWSCKAKPILTFSSLHQEMGYVGLHTDFALSFSGHFFLVHICWYMLKLRDCSCSKVLHGDSELAIVATLVEVESSNQRFKLKVKSSNQRENPIFPWGLPLKFYHQLWLRLYHP